MASRRIDPRWRGRARQLGVFLAFLLPGLALVALLAPAAVTVHTEGEEETVGLPSFRDLKIGKRPLLARRDFTSNFVAGHVDVESLFSSAKLSGQADRRLVELPPVVDDSQEIVLSRADDGVERYVQKDLFDSTTEQPILAVDLEPRWNPDVFDIIPPLLSRYGHSQYDDFFGNGAALSGPVRQPFMVPEPATGVLLALYYSPSATDSWASVAYIQDQVTLGWFVRGLHSYGASAMVMISDSRRSSMPGVG